MKEENAKSKKKLIYYLTLAISLVLLIVATVLTVYFVTGAGNDDVLDNPPPIENPDDGKKPDDGNKPDQKPDDDKKPDDKPTGGDDTVKFVVPLSYSKATEFNSIYASQTTGFIYRHKAVDFAAEEGTEICSMADGTVKEISLNETTGNYITVDHGDGLITLYRFVEPVKDLKAGDKVKKGDKIATVAAAYGSEAKDGTHLHLEVSLKGVPQNPADYIEIVNTEK